MKRLMSLLLIATVAVSMVAETYSLTQATSVETGKQYVIERNNRVLTGTVTSSKLQTTDEYVTTELTGEEAYVWVLEATDVDTLVYVKNGEKYLNNTSSSGVSLSKTATSKWFISFDEGVALFTNVTLNNRFLGETSEGSGEYKAYAAQNLETYGHDFTVYELVEGDTPTGVFEGTSTTNNVKFVKDNHLYFRVGDKVYNASGMEVR